MITSTLNLTLTLSHMFVWSHVSYMIYNSYC